MSNNRQSDWWSNKKIPTEVGSMFSRELAHDSDRRHLMSYSQTGHFGRNTSQRDRDDLKFRNIAGIIQYYAHQSDRPIDDLNKLLEQAKDIRTERYKDEAFKLIDWYVPPAIWKEFADYDQKLREAREEAENVGTFRNVETDFWLMVRSVKIHANKAHMERGHFISHGLHNLPFAHKILHELKGRMETFREEAKVAVRQGKRPAEKTYANYKQNPPGGGGPSIQSYYRVH
jgi:hypothetical protein